MLSISCFAMVRSGLPTVTSAGCLNSETSISSSGKCISSSISPFSCGFTAARCCRARMTTLAMAILPASIKSIPEQHISFVAALCRLRGNTACKRAGD